MDRLHLAQGGIRWQDSFLSSIHLAKDSYQLGIYLTLFILFQHIPKYAKSDLSLSCLSACPSAWNNLASTGHIFMKFGIIIFFENLLRKFKFD